MINCMVLYIKLKIQIINDKNKTKSKYKSHHFRDKGASIEQIKNISNY